MLHGMSLVEHQEAGNLRICIMIMMHGAKKVTRNDGFTGSFMTRFILEDMENEAVSYLEITSSLARVTECSSKRALDSFFLLVRSKRKLRRSYTSLAYF